MKKFHLLVLVILILGSCTQSTLTDEQIEAEKAAIKDQIMTIHNAYNENNLEPLKELSSSGEFMAFGTDKSEVMKSKADWKKQMEADSKAFSAMKIEDPKNLSIVVASSGDLASAIYETDASITVDGETSPMFFRFAYTWEKEDGNWKIRQLLASMPSSGQSAEDWVAKREAQKEASNNDENIEDEN
ncbi:nuclear transport factor 2 family protein [Mangrovivirga sp. M17]|uniref:Nuclear transport factor 2 family protein n=1 Tax=Mangrovivirga halotolerans TaxID=2993936 RepID=A0ABT3RUT5_9BACT|nr:nuclear transport factor 2 family protein [Mangrovivirga halotolerans]MCX2745535.1 nuclear transport factor 2 family protein [Mangrovivirga halotolerans]